MCNVIILQYFMTGINYSQLEKKTETKLITVIIIKQRPLTITRHEIYI